MSKQKIKQVAINQFYRNGYEGVKMSQIAEEAGIRKQSLSYHYPSKKELFMELYKEVIDAEIVFTQSFFDRFSSLPPKEVLYSFLKEVSLRAYDKPNTGFLQALSFAEPLEIQSYVSAHYIPYLNTLKTEIKKVFDKETFNYTSDECTVAFIVLFDGLIVDLLYNTKQSFDYSLDISYKIFWNNIQG
ncbi:MULTISPECIES: TetR/AcrR family transcriptional regulator [Shouchella]|uniref:TetR/AcrR family transcriptional regulator n=1 Tax=Shouchella TaxID=2893057 RepID=UPI000B973841|nr:MULTISPECIES: TetR/AcrR family transcriptional regulator [Shouchella]PAD40872.1 TetR family transcriptional regulator [Bacillus sp. 7520-S]AST94519.1 TetR family transcriptional regulator [Shouchella clausii]MCR1290156.1 TetR/AcrR family transcriptional regulator [Shouchella clausii]MEB5473031.1 TetR/AcrR family transcriptional regulator [Shouchella clausii]PAD90369.1 TetR family transcriptional regulator [Shouchella clausii]